MYHAVRALLVAAGVDLFRNGFVTASRSHSDSERRARSDDLARESDYQNDGQSIERDSRSDIH